MVRPVRFDTKIGINNRSHTGDTNVRFVRDREKSNTTFPAAICASNPLAIVLGVNADPPLFGPYQTEPGSCAHTLCTQSRFCSYATHMVRSRGVEINPQGLKTQERCIFGARCTAGLVDIILEMLRENSL